MKPVKFAKTKPVDLSGQDFQIGLLLIRIENNLPWFYTPPTTAFLERKPVGFIDFFLNCWKKRLTSSSSQHLMFNKYIP